MLEDLQFGMRNLLIGMLCVAVVVLLFQMHSQSVALKALQQQKAQTPPIPSLELQEKCAKQAAVEYRQEGLDAKPMAEFTDHYSATLGRCFVITKNTETTGNVISTHKLLTDAYEGKVYGDYLWINSQGKKYWEVAPTDCSVTLPSGEEKQCKSSEEWDELAKAYTDVL